MRIFVVVVFLRLSFICSFNPSIALRHHLKRLGTKRRTELLQSLESEKLLDALIMPEATQPIILQWSPQRKSIWSRWKGTVWQTTALPTFCLSCLSLALCLTAKQGFGMPFNANAGRFFLALQRLDRLWQMHLTVVTFILSFYLNTAKTLFDSVLVATRQVQGRLNDMNLIAASHAKRDASGNMTPESKDLCDVLGRYTRLFVVLFYSAQCRLYESLLTKEGLAGMLKRGLVTQEESNILSTLPPKGRYNAVFSWIMSTFTRGCEGPDPQVRMPANAHFAFLLRMTDLRNSCATITDLVDARCPLAYVHLVQLLVDSFLLMTPFAALGQMGWFSVAATFLLSLFFSGLMDLSKMLYDPLDNEVFGDIDNIQIDTVIQEINNGSRRFASTGSLLPGGARDSTSMIVPELNLATW
jgi:hypothetical protein